MEWELNIYRPATARKVGQFQLCVKKPMGRKGRFLTPQPQIVFCPWAEEGFLAYFDNVLFCLMAVRLMPGNCSVSGLRHCPPSSQPNQWKCRVINVTLAPTCSPVKGPFKGGLLMALSLKVSRGKEGGVFWPHGQLEFSLRLERACLTHLGGTLFCKIGSQACALLHLSHWARTPWLLEF